MTRNRTNISRSLLALTLAAGAALAAASSPAARGEEAKKPLQTPPAPAPTKPVRFPSFTQKTLANGLQVVVIEQHETPSISVRLLVNAGKVFAPAEKAGLAGATAELLTKGTANRTAQGMAEEIDLVGGAVGANAGGDAGFVNAHFTSDQLDLALDLVADVTLHPTFPPEEVERWRKQHLSNLQIEQGSAPYLAGAALSRLTFGDHPYGLPGGGTPESIKSLTRDDFVAFHHAHYIPNGSILAVVGDVKAVDALAKVEARFGGWAKGTESKIPEVRVVARDKPLLVVIDKPDAVQTELRVGQVGIAFRDPDLFTAQVFEGIVGSGPDSRLYNEIRQKRGLSYGAAAAIVASQQPGPFVASTFTKTESTVEALGLMLEVLRGLQKDPVPAPELDAAKTFISGAFPLEIETGDGIADKILEALRYGYGREFVETYNTKIDAVTPADVQTFAKGRIHPEGMILVLAGNAKVFHDELEKKFGPFETIPAADFDPLRADLRRPKAAAQAAAPGDQAKARALLEKARTAMGGKAFANQKTQVTKGSGTITPPGAPNPMPFPSVVNYQVFPNKMRGELQLPFGQLIQAFDGTTGWASIGGQVSDQTTEMSDEQFLGLEILRWYDKPGMTAKPLDSISIGGKAAEGAEVADDKGHATQFYFDSQTHLPSKVSFTSGGNTNEATFGDYRPVKGVQIAFETHVVRNGAPLVDIKLSEAQVDVPVDEALFSKPAAKP